MTPDQLALYISENIPVIRTTKDARWPCLEFKGVKYYEKTVSAFFLSILEYQAVGEFLPKIAPHEYPSIFRRIEELLKEKEERAKDPQELEAINSYMLRSCVLIYNVEDARNRIVFDTSSGEVTDIDPLSLCLAHGKKDIDLRLAKAGLLKYDPYSPQTIREVEYHGQKVKLVNMHKRPEWRKIGVVAAGCPPEFEEFFRHLFPYKPAREYVFSWLREAIYGRNGTILCLNAAKGTGKTILASLLANLVGQSNYRKAPTKFLDHHFNKLLSNTRFIFMDEQKMVTEEQDDVLKSYCNKMQTIHLKGKDIEKSQEVFYSMILANNREIDLRLSFEDRRYSVPEITKVPLLKVWSQERVKRFVLMIEDPQILAQFANYLNTHHFWSDGYGEEVPYKGEKFRHICDISMYEYERFIFDFIVQKALDGVFEINFDDMAAEWHLQSNKKKTLTWRAAGDFLKRPYQSTMYASAYLANKKKMIKIVPECVGMFKKYWEETYKEEDEADAEISLGGAFL